MRGHLFFFNDFFFYLLLVWTCEARHMRPGAWAACLLGKRQTAGPDNVNSAFSRSPLLRNPPSDWLSGPNRRPRRSQWEPSSTRVRSVSRTWGCVKTCDVVASCSFRSAESGSSPAGKTSEDVWVHLKSSGE